jgi:outer membrane protein OmpA-like peptidoglycan-associated protein/outer membrane protein W
MKLRLALAAATCLALPLVAHAQPVTGPYVSLSGGTSIANPIGFEDRAAGTAGKVQLRNSYAGDTAIGYGFGNGFRVELNGDFYRNTVHKLKYNGGPDELATGGLNTYGPMVNALYDMDVGLPIFPYVGAGAGYQWQKFNSETRSAFDGVAGTRGSFAYNIIAGVAYPLAMVPGLSLTGEYKFTQLVESRNYHDFPAGGDTTVHIGQSSSHTFLVGVRYQLLNPPPPAPPAPAPAPVAAPAPAPARTFLVFFDWDKYNLTPRATEIISEAASDSKSSSVTTLDVSGYTDTSGTPDYNMGLSERRAKAVAAQLETDGVPASEIEIHAYGETHLLVATGPGVREPQNRRVEIVLH